MTVYAVKKSEPHIHDTCFVAPNASVIGAVQIGKDSSVWPFASLRGDSNTIRIGERTSVQDNAVIHTEHARGTHIGDDVTIGHNAIVHACTVQDTVLIGMGAIILSGAEIGEESIIAAGAVVPEDTKIPPRSLVMGVPGKIVRELTGEEVARIQENAQVYVEKIQAYRETFEVFNRVD